MTSFADCDHLAVATAPGETGHGKTDSLTSSRIGQDGLQVYRQRSRDNRGPTEIIEAVGGRMPVLVDSGFRRGTDIFKALAMGARAVAIGRPYIWGLSAFGQTGVERVFDILTRELTLVMGQCGARSIREITPASIVNTSRA